MITTIFNGGQPPDSEKDFLPLIGDSQEDQYSIALSLLIIAVIMIPIYLLIRPCFFSTAADRPDEEEVENSSS